MISIIPEARLNALSSNAVTMARAASALPPHSLQKDPVISIKESLQGNGPAQQCQSLALRDARIGTWD